MSLQELKARIKSETSRAYKLNTKKARHKTWAKIRELEREARSILYAQRDKFGPHSVKGTVIYFHKHDDHFLVNTPYGTMWISPTCDILSKSWYASTCCVEYDKGQEIIIEVEIDLAEHGLGLAAYPKRVHGGRLNETEYTELCKRNDLAFFKYPDGRMSGLFA